MSDRMDHTDDIYELDELLGAYALDAVDDIERRRVEDYLAVNPRAAAEVRDHQEVATMLAFTGMDAPDGVWNKIAAELESEAPAPTGGLKQVLDSGEVPVIDVSRQPPASPRSSSWWLAAAACVALLVAGFAVLSRNDDGATDHLAEAYDAVAAADGTIDTELVAEGRSEVAAGVIGADGRGFIDASNLPRLSSDQTYQLWGVLADTGDVVSIGIVGPEPALEPFSVDGAVAALALTIEDAPGVISDGNPEGAYVGSFE